MFNDDLLWSIMMWIENVYIVWNNVMFNDDLLRSIMMCDARLRMFILSGTMLCLMMINYGQL